MSECEKCHVLSEDLAEGQRWALVIETQRCIWDIPKAMPEVDIAGADEVAAYCC